MSAFDAINDIPLHYLENLFSKPSYLRGLRYIKTLPPLSTDESNLGLFLMEELPQNGIPIKGKLYLKKNGSNLEYTVLTPTGQVFTNQSLDIELIGNTLNSSSLRSDYGEEILKPEILEKTSKKGHTPLKGTDQTTLLLNKTFEDLWLAFKAMPFFTGNNLSLEEQRYYNILLKGEEKKYQPMATLYAINKFTFSYFETFLQSLHFDQFSEKLAQAVFRNELSNDFIEHSIKNFLNLVKANLPSQKPRNTWQSSPLWVILYEYKSKKETSLNPHDKLIFGTYSNWLNRFVS
jgi:hypothetical protein